MKNLLLILILILIIISTGCEKYDPPYGLVNEESIMPESMLIGEPIFLSGKLISFKDGNIIEIGGRLSIKDSAMLEGKWLLNDGNRYISINGGENFCESHFNGNSTHSNLRYLNGSQPIFKIEEIIKDITIWEFTNLNNGNGNFILNRDIDNPYDFYIDKNFITITENSEITHPNEMQLGGSKRPLGIYKINGGIIILVQEGYACGLKYRYFNILKFKKIN